MEKKYLKIELVAEKPKTNFYRIISNHDQSILGHVYWHGPGFHRSGLLGV